MCLQKHYHPYTKSTLLTSSNKFSFSRTVSFRFCLLDLKIKHSITHWHYYSCLDAHVWMYIILCINPFEKVCEFKTPNDTIILYRLIQVLYTSSKFFLIIHTSLCNPCVQEYHSWFYIWSFTLFNIYYICC